MGNRSKRDRDKKKVPKQTLPSAERKAPVASRIPKVVKQPTSAPSANLYAFSPKWILSSVDMAGPFGWNRCKSHEDVLTFLQHLEQLSWKEILSSKNNHQIQIGKLSADAQKRFDELGHDDFDEVVSLRMGGKPRVFGILLPHGVCAVLWWDPDHLVCPAPKRHT